MIYFKQVKKNVHTQSKMGLVSFIISCGFSYVFLDYRLVQNTSDNVHIDRVSLEYAAECVFSDEH